MATAPKKPAAPRFTELLERLSDAARSGKLTEAVDILTFIADARGWQQDAAALGTLAQQLDH